VNRTLPSLHEGSLDITLTVPLSKSMLAHNTKIPTSVENNKKGRKQLLFLLILN